MTSPEALGLAQSFRAEFSSKPRNRKSILTGLALAAHIIRRETPVKVKEGAYIHQSDYTCGSCDMTVSALMSFCPRCGSPLDWGRV